MEPGTYHELETELKIRGYSEQTIRAYVYENKRFMDFVKSLKTHKEYQKSLISSGYKTPSEITKADLRQYQAFLVADKSLKPSSINLSISALRFFYVDVLKKDFFNEIKRPKKEEKLPVVLSKDEVRSILDGTRNKKHKTLIELLYGTGIRVSEAINLKKDDFDFNEKINFIRGGKGKKDRRIILPDRLRRKLNTYVARLSINNPYLFPSRKGHITPRQAQRIVKNAAIRAGIKKDVFCHALRSTFATHLINSGVDIRDIQVLLGHKRISTTQIYTEVSNERLQNIKSPLDKL